jgi:primosomal protein N' (replication factor Y)
MHYFEVAPNKIIRADSNFFTYSYESLLQIGQIVTIEVGKRQLIGVVLRQVSRPPYPTKSISSIINHTPLPHQLVKTAQWLSAYYATPLASVLQSILPGGIQKKRQPQQKQTDITKRNRTNIVFNSEQASVLNKISKYEDGTFLLQGITGSGKTELYIDVAKQTIFKNRSIVILVPEIALTPQLISEFSNHFENLIVTHSKMSESSRHTAWLEALNSTKPRIVIGPRSALFMPLKNIGAIIIDEAHEPSYKQEQSPKYSALRTATILGRSHKAKVIFGSATPNITDRYLAEHSKRPILKLNNTARSNSKPPIITLVDMTKRGSFNKHRFFSKQLIDQITETLSINKQVLIFHNRRGSTSTTLCKDCGWTAECLNCFLPMSLHSDHNKLICHICGYNTSVPTSCLVCGNINIVHKGIGTKLIEAELRKLFTSANIARFDTDNKNEDAIYNRYSDLYNGVIDIAIGTQIIAKGLDLPNLRTVGVIQADAGLAIPDFNTNERTFQLLTQVIGRVGRNEHQTYVVVQTYKPTHPSITNGLVQDYESFYKQTIQERKRGLFPPFSHLLKLTCIYKTEAAVIKNSKQLAKDLQVKLHNDVQILGPTPSFYERQNSTYRWQLVLKSPRREYLLEAIKQVPKTHWQVELDPTSLL